MNSLDTAQIKQTTWEKLSGKWTPACLGFLFFFIILTVIDIPSIFFEEESIGQALYNSIWGPIEWALTWVLDIGIIAFYYDIVCNRPLYYKERRSTFSFSPRRSASMRWLGILPTGSLKS